MLTVIGIGNPERGDDAVGVLIARRLRAELPDVCVLDHSGEGAGLIELLRDRESVIVIDAADFGAAPGDIHTFDAALEPIPAELCTPSSHGFGLAQALELARALGSLPASCRVFAIQAESFELGAAVSFAVSTAAETVIEQIRSAASEAQRSPGPLRALDQPLTANR